MNSKRPSIAKSTVRAASGGVIVVAALLALMFLRGGLGSGDNSDNSDSESGGESTETPAATNLVTTDAGPDTELTSILADNNESDLTPDEQRALSGSVLAVLIDEYSYLLEIPGDEATLYRPLELERLLQLARRTEGDSNGIRVRILRRESARTNAEVDLRSALEDIGIGADAVYMPADFVP